MVAVGIEVGVEVGVVEVGIEVGYWSLMERTPAYEDESFAFSSSI
jgi:hypothetical protein